MMKYWSRRPGSGEQFFRRRAGAAADQTFVFLAAQHRASPGNCSRRDISRLRPPRQLVIVGTPGPEALLAQSHQSGFEQFSNGFPQCAGIDGFPGGVLFKLCLNFGHR